MLHSKQFVRKCWEEPTVFNAIQLGPGTQAGKGKERGSWGSNPGEKDRQKRAYRSFQKRMEYSGPIQKQPQPPCHLVHHTRLFTMVFFCQAMLMLSQSLPLERAHAVSFSATGSSFGISGGVWEGPARNGASRHPKGPPRLAPDVKVCVILCVGIV